MEPVRAYRVEPRSLVRLPPLLPEILKPVLAAATVAGLADDFSPSSERVCVRRAGPFIGMSATNKGAFIASKQMVSGAVGTVLFGSGIGEPRFEHVWIAITSPCLAPVTAIRPPKIEFR